MKTRFLALLVLLGVSVASHATLIEIVGSGEYIDRNIPTNPVFSFRFVYDTAAAESVISPTESMYTNAVSDFVITTDIEASFFSPTSDLFDVGAADIQVLNDGSFFGGEEIDLIGFYSERIDINGIPSLGVGVTLLSVNLDVFTSTSLPVDLELSDFQFARFSLVWTVGTVTGPFQRGDITSLTLRPLVPASVPEPASLGLVGLGLIALGLRRRLK